METFEKKIKELRQAAGLSQDKLARQIGVAVKSIQRYEKGYRPDSYALVKLASFFDVTTDYLLGLSSYENQMKERKDKMKEGNGYNELYTHYLKCLNEYEIVQGEDYYWIEMEDNYIGGQYMWSGWADEECKLEVRKLRPVIPEKAIELCSKVKGRPMILNTQLDAAIFLIYGGQAIVREDICKNYLPRFFEEIVVDNTENEY